MMAESAACSHIYSILVTIFTEKMCFHYLILSHYNIANIKNVLFYQNCVILKHTKIISTHIFLMSKAYDNHRLLIYDIIQQA